MAQIGVSTKPSTTFYGYDGSAGPNQFAEKFTMPERGRITTLGMWAGGWNDAPSARLVLWDEDGVIIGQSAAFTVANRGVPATGAVDNYEKALEAAVEVEAGAIIYVGIGRQPEGAMQISLGPSGAAHENWRYNSPGTPWPSNVGTWEAGTPSPNTRRIGAYAIYDPLANIKVYRGGVWVDAEKVQVLRGGIWVDAEAVQIRRAGAWVDAE